MKIIFLLSIIVFTISNVNSRISMINIQFRNGWSFVQKFAFLTKEGQSKVTLKVNNQYNTNFLMAMFIDNEDLWNLFLDTKPTCQQLRISKLSHIITSLNNTSSLSVVDNTTVYTNYLWFPSNDQSFYTFSVLLACDRTEYFSAYIEAIYTNGGQFFRYHFSADEFYILESSIFFFITYLILIIIFGFYRKMLKIEQRESILTILFGIVISIKFIVFFCQMWIYLNYAATGVYSYVAFVIFELFNQYSVLLFMELLILLGFGLTTIFGKLVSKISITVLSTGIVYFILVTIMYIIYLANYNSAYASNIYDQFCGYFLVSVEVIMALTFLVGCSMVIAKHKAHREFYFCFLFFIFIWFISVPILILLSLFYVKAYLRFSVVIITRNSMDLFAHLIYMLITYPKLFPDLVMFTAPTNQIAPISYDEAMETDSYTGNRSEEGDLQFSNLSGFQNPK